MQPPLGVFECAPVGGFRVRPRWGFSGVPLRGPFFVYGGLERMTETSAGFVDAGYLIAEGAKAVNKRPKQVFPRASYVTEWINGESRRDHSDILV